MTPENKLPQQVRLAVGDVSGYVAFAESISADGPNGTAWLCASNLAITAAHVVPLNGQLRLIFGGGRRAIARCIDQNLDLDAALLVLEEIHPSDGPQGFLPSNLDGDIRINQFWRSWGHPVGEPTGFAVDGTVSGISRSCSTNQLFLYCKQPVTDQLRGLSGGPVIDEAGTVIGIITEFTNQLGHTLIASRLDEIWRRLPKWREFDPQLISHGKISRYLEKQVPLWVYPTYLSSFRKKIAPDFTNFFVEPRFRHANVGRQRQVSAGLRVEDLIEQLHADGRHMVISGDPGSGKSVFLRWLCVGAAKAWSLRETNREIPVLLHASEIAKDFDLDGALARISPIFDGPPPEGVSWLVFIDGLDEIVDVDDRRRVLARVKEHVAFTRNMRRVMIRIVVASRPLAILDELPESDAKHYVLKPFTVSQIETFAENWFRDAPIGEGASEFLDELRASRLEQIVSTPSLATMAAVVFEKSADKRLPRLKSDLFDRFIELSLEERDQKVRERFYEQFENLYPGLGREIGGKVWRARESIATWLAVQVQEGSLQAANADFSSVAVEWVADQQILCRERCGSIREEAVRHLMTDILIASGLFVLLGNGSLCFFHNTLREALAARAMANTPHSSSPDIWAVARRWVDVRWREIVLLVLVQWSREKGNSKSEMWSVLLPIIEGSIRGQHFVATALGEGLELDAQAEAFVINLMLERLDKWNPCMEIYSEFRSPNPADVLRVLSPRKSFLAALLKRLQSGGVDCSIKKWSLAEISLDTGSVSALIPLLEESSVSNIAAMLIARAGRVDLVLRQLIEIASIGSKCFNIARIIGEEGTRDQQIIFAQCNSIDAQSRLFAALIALSRNDDHPLRRIAINLFNGLLQNEKFDLDDAVALRVVKSGMQIDFSQGNATNRFRLLRAAAEIGVLVSDATLRGVRRMTADQALDHSVRIGAARILLELSSSTDSFKALDDLVNFYRDDFECRHELAKTLASHGQPQYLTEIANSESNSFSARVLALIELARAGYRDTARDLLVRLPLDQEKNDADLYSLYMAIGDKERATKITLSRAKRGFARVEMRTLMEMGNPDEIVALVLALDESSYKEKRYGISCLFELAAAEHLMRIASDPGLPIPLSLFALKKLGELGWLSEAENIRFNLSRRIEFDASIFWVSQISALCNLKPEDQAKFSPIIEPFLSKLAEKDGLWIKSAFNYRIRSEVRPIRFFAKCGLTDRFIEVERSQMKESVNSGWAVEFFFRNNQLENDSSTWETFCEEILRYVLDKDSLEFAKRLGPVLPSIPRPLVVLVVAIRSLSPETLKGNVGNPIFILAYPQEGTSDGAGNAAIVMTELPT